MTRLPGIGCVAALLAGLLPFAAHAEPHCVLMKFFDRQGVAIPMPGPVIGIMVGGKPAMNADGPTGSVAQPGAEIACPETLVAEVEKLFQDSCVTEQRRNQAAIDRRQKRSVIDKGCLDMAQTLGGKVQPTP